MSGEENDEKENEGKGKKSSDTLRKALIGLIGTLLTACGGLTGALVSAGFTVYQVEREAQQVALAAPGGDQALTVDTRQIAIHRGEAENLAADEYAVDMDLGFVMAQPHTGWAPIETITFSDLLDDQAAASPLIYFFGLVDTAWDEQPIRRIRYAEPVKIQYQESSTENGIPINLETLRRLTGGDTMTYYSQFTVLVADKQAAPDIPLATIALTWGPDPLRGGGANHIVANRDSQYILMQATSQLKNVKINGQEVDSPIEYWALFAEGPQHYYIVELNYVPAPNQPPQMWEDLQAYLDAFRIVQ